RQGDEEGVANVQPAVREGGERGVGPNVADVVGAVQEPGLHLLRGQVREGGPEQGGGSSHVRGGHRRAVVPLVAPAGDGAPHVYPGGGQIDGDRPPVGERSHAVLVVGGGDGNDTWRVETGRVHPQAAVLLVGVTRLVADRSDEQDARGAHGINRV